MKLLKNAFITILITLVIVSCKLNLDPPGDILQDEALSTADDLERAANGLYSIVGDGNLLGGYYKFIPDIISDQVYVLNESRANFLSEYQRQLARTGWSTWDNSYDAINSANILIDYIEKNKIPSTPAYEQNKDRILGEAYFVRGVMFFELVRLWGFQYLKSGNYPIAQSGIVLNTEPTTAKVNKPRATVNEVYEQVESDLQTAIRLLPKPLQDGNDEYGYNGQIHPRSYQGRANSDAARGYLIKVLFQKANLQDYERLVAHADTLIGPASGTSLQRYTYQLNFQSDFNPYTFSGLNKSSETIFQIINIKTGNLVSSTINSIQNLYRQNRSNNLEPPYVMARSTGGNRIFINRYFQPSGDVREINVDGTNSFLRKYDLDFQNIPIIRSPEILLSRAEANFLLGNESAAHNDMLTLATARKSRRYTDTTTVSLTAIGDERVRELYGEGDRLHNLKRMAAYDVNEGTKYNITTLPSGTRPTNPEPLLDARLLWEIPEPERFSNPIIQPNGVGN